MKKTISRSLGIIAVTALMTVTGCITIRWGTPPMTDQLDALKVGISDKAEVQRVLGEPRGLGMLRHSGKPAAYLQKIVADPGSPMGLTRPYDPDPTRRDMWFYEYTEGTTSTMDLKFLLIFFLGDTYDGHLWFSSSKILQR